MTDGKQELFRIFCPLFWELFRDFLGENRNYSKKRSACCWAMGRFSDEQSIAETQRIAVCPIGLCLPDNTEDETQTTF